MVGLRRHELVLKQIFKFAIFSEIFLVDALLLLGENFLEQSLVEFQIEVLIFGRTFI
jgi:hypothetical protein